MTTLHMTPATAAELAEALHGRVVDHFGDARILIGGDIVYAGCTGKVRVDHRGRVTDLGKLSDGVDELAAAYRVAVAS